MSNKVDRRGKGPLTKRMHWPHAFFALNNEWQVFHFTNVQESGSYLARHCKKAPQDCSFSQGFLHPSVYLGRHWCNLCLWWVLLDFPLCFSYCKLQKAWVGASLPGLPHFYLPFVFTIIHRSRRGVNYCEGKKRERPENEAIYWCFPCY